MSNNKHIYESPDGGKTVTRRLFGSDVKELLNDFDVDINDAILMDSINYHSNSVTYNKDGSVTVFKDDKELWDIPVDLYSTKVRTLLSVDILQQLKKLIYK